MAQLNSPTKRAACAEEAEGPGKQELQLLQQKINSLENHKSGHVAELGKLNKQIKEYEKARHISEKEMELVKKELTTALTKNVVSNFENYGASGPAHITNRFVFFPEESEQASGAGTPGT